MKQGEFDKLVADWREAQRYHEEAVERLATHKRSCPPKLFRYPSVDAYNAYVAKASAWEAEEHRLSSAAIGELNRLGYAAKPLLDVLPHNVWIGTGGGILEVARVRQTILCQEIDTSGPDPEHVEE